MLRSSFCSAALWGSLALLAATGQASAQWSPFGGSSCGCGARSFASAPIMQSASYSSFGAAYSPIHQTAMSSGAVQCGQPIACTIDPPPMATAMVHMQAIAPVQTAKVEPMQQVIQPVYNTVHVTEYQAVKQKVQRPVVETQMVDQAVTVMQPVTVQRTANVPTVDYQTVTEYHKVQKQAGYWATKTEATGKVNPWQYDNRPTLLGFMNRTGYVARTAFVPQTRVSRTYVPQTMTCTVPCTKKVAVQGMKQVTYNVTTMQPTQTTRKVAVNTVRYVEQEVTAMQPVTVARTVHVGHRITYQSAGSSSSASASAAGPTPIGGGPATATGPAPGGPTALQPTADEKASARKPSSTPSRTADGSSNDWDVNSPISQPRSSNDSQPKDADQSELAETIIPTRPAMKIPSAVRVSQWVAHNPSPNAPQPAKASSTMSVAGK